MNFAILVIKFVNVFSLCHITVLFNSCICLLQGRYVYELFSIMIHSGSAIGGHYYAYIK